MLWVSQDESLNKYLTTLLSQTKGTRRVAASRRLWHVLEARQSVSWLGCLPAQSGWRRGSSASWCW